MSINEEIVDDLLYTSRAGDLEQFQTTLTQIVQPEVRTAASTSAVLKQVQRANEAQNSPLHYACANGHENVVEYLLPLCTSDALMAQNESGNTPLHWAAFNGHLNIVKALVDRIEAQVPKKEEESKVNGTTTEEEKDAELEREAQRRSVWDVVNKAGRGPMSEAQMNNKEAVVDFLLQRMVTAPAAAAAATATDAPQEEEEAKEVSNTNSQDEERGADDVRPNTELSYKVEQLSVNGANEG